MEAGVLPARCAQDDDCRPEIPLCLGDLSLRFDEEAEPGRLSRDLVR